ncbi:MAG TPA: hypothetical protein VMF89_34855, partial [Polyangiales bacterium]|nr:hypothetical protein [Polyangiales bacterium]
AELAALKAKDVLMVRIDAESAVAFVLGQLPRIVRLRPQIEEAFLNYNLVQFDKLEQFAWCFLHAQDLYRAAIDARGFSAEDVRQGSRLRAVLIEAVQVLVNAGLVRPLALDRLTLKKGYQHIGEDLALLLKILQRQTGANRPASLEQELGVAAELGERFRKATLEREARIKAIAHAADQRRRAFTLFLRAYDQARRATCYLRGIEEDWDDYTPSLFAGRAGRPEQETPHSEVFEMEPRSGMKEFRHAALLEKQAVKFSLN